MDAGSSCIYVEIFCMISCTPIGSRSCAVGVVLRRTIELNHAYIKLYVFKKIYVIVYTLDHVDHEDLPHNGCWCTVYCSTTQKISIL